MSRPRKDTAPALPGGIHSTRLHVVLYSLLLIATPFVVLRRFLQDAVGRCSRAGLDLGGVNIPIVPVVALLVAAVLLFRFRAHLTKLRILAGLIALAMNAAAQQFIDYYYAHSFYDLQQNWHYLAYMVFAFMMARDLAPRGIAPARRILITYVAAVMFSTFDEVVQLRISSRAFELNDIAKDAWGALMGLTVLNLGGTPAEKLRWQWTHLTQRRLREYFANPASLLLLLVILTFLFLFYAALWTERHFTPLVIGLSVATFAVVFVLFHISQFRWGRYGLATALVLAVGAQSWAYVRHRDDYITHNQYGLTVYKGVPLPLVDVLIFPDGSFRPVDKKVYFNHRDQAFLARQRSDIILIGSGVDGVGGRGFDEDAPSHFIYNQYTKRPTQVIILKSPEACATFNRLKREGKSVVFVLHSTGRRDRK